MARLKRLAAVTIATSFLTLFIPAPAHASCTEVPGVEDLGCLERALCPRVIFRNCVQ